MIDSGVRLNVRTIACVSLLGAAGCTGSDKGGDDMPEGGGASLAVLVFGSSESALASAAFYSEYEGGGSAGSPSLDQCVDADSVTLEPATISYLDVGDTVTFTSGATSVVANIDGSPPQILYGSGPISPSPPVNADYSVTVPGNGEVAATTFEMLHVPDSVQASLSAPVVVAGAVSFPAGADLNLTWTPMGADELSLYLTGAGVGGTLCSMRDDGAFTVPSARIDALPATGNFVLSAFSFREAELDGRALVLLGSTGLSVPFARN